MRSRRATSNIVAAAEYCQRLGGSAHRSSRAESTLTRSNKQVKSLIIIDNRSCLMHFSHRYKLNRLNPVRTLDPASNTAVNLCPSSSPAIPYLQPFLRLHRTANNTDHLNPSACPPPDNHHHRTQSPTTLSATQMARTFPAQLSCVAGDRRTKERARAQRLSHSDMDGMESGATESSRPSRN